jgi:hypothetical protein
MSDQNNDFIDKIYEDAVKDKSLISTLNIDELIKMTNSENMDYLNEKTTDDILNETLRTISELDINEKTKQLYYHKLAGYRAISNIYEIHKGKHIRWIRNNSPDKITNGAIVAEIKFYDSGTHILCRTVQNRLFQIKYDDCTIFQKLSTGEQLILMAYEYSKNIKI